MGVLKIDKHNRVIVDKQKQTVLVNHFLRKGFKKTLSQLDVPEYSDEEYDRVLYSHLWSHRHDTIQNFAESLWATQIAHDEEIILSFVKYCLFDFLEARIAIDIEDYLSKDIVMEGVYQFLKLRRSDEF